MKKNTPDLYVVGIGASAGGLDAIQQLFDQMPDDTGMAFVIIQHLSPDFVSLMPELLAKHTTMQIFTTEDKQTIQPNCIYLNQRNKNLHIKGRELYLLDKGPKHNLNLPIDIFFHTLGEEYKEKSVGIILSGTGSDGSRGIKTIKEAGGIVISQDPSSAQFDGMPNSAIATNQVDFILDPENIADVFKKLPINRLMFSVEIGGNQSNEVLFNSILEEVYRYSSIDFREYKKNTLQRRLEKRMNINNIEKLYDYLTFLKSNTSEKEILKQDFLIGVTQFFRDTDAFESLKKNIIPSICKSKKPSDTIRIWTAGCSTGEEVYSIAILFDHYIKTNKLALDFKIFATDIDQRAIENAGVGSFFINSANELEKIYLEKYFLKIGDKIEIIKRIREKIVFSSHNILVDPPFIKMDLITCRNLLIYLEKKGQKKVLDNFTFALNKFGYLFLGNSESLASNSPAYKTIDTKWKLFQSISTAKYVPSQSHIDQRLDSVVYKHTLRSSSQNSLKTKENPETIFAKYLSKKYSPATIFINKNFEILYMIGDAGKRLNHNDGVFQSNLLKVLSPDIAPIVRNGIRKLDKFGKDIIIKDIHTNVNNNHVSFDITLHKPTNTETLGDTYAVQFSDDTVQKSKAIVLKNIPIDEISKQRMEDLENELKATRTELQNVVEELETSNEELQSSNEELMASNEELQSTNEELQSVNEELYTVNTEMNEKNKELQYLNNDITNLLDSIEIATLFLDEFLNIRKFTPALQKHFKLQDTDIGRPILSFAANFNDKVRTTIITDAQFVLDNLKPIEKEIESLDGKSYLIRIIPFITSAKKIDGVVISLVDLTELKDNKAKLEKSELLLSQSQKIAKVGGWELNIANGELLWTDETYRIHETTPEEFNPTVDAGVSYFLPESKKIISKALDEAINKGKGYDLILETHTTKGHKIDVRTTCEVIFEKDKPSKLIGIFQDITTYRDTEKKLIKAKKIAELASKEKNLFLANMSHEIRTPMNGVIGFSGLLRNENLSKQKKEQYLNIIDASSKQLMTLIDDIIDIAKIEAREIKINNQVFDVNKMLKNLKFTYEELKEIKQKDDVKLILEVPNIPHFFIKSDEKRINQVFINLLNNALKFTEKGTIKFGFKPKDEHLEFFVSDTGMGIPNDKLEEIFGSFKQAHTNLAKHGGTGLGLAISKGILTLLNGNIKVHSIINKGTTFNFELPLKVIDKQNEQLTQIKSSSKTERFLEGKKVLVVEDEPYNQIYLEDILSSLNLNLVIVDDGKKAIDVYKKENDFDIILMDIRLPKIDGITATKEILKFDSSAKIIMQTAHAMLDELEKCVKIGCAGYLTKPLNKENLVNELFKALN